MDSGSSGSSKRSIELPETLSGTGESNKRSRHMDFAYNLPEYLDRDEVLNRLEKKKLYHEQRLAEIQAELSQIAASASSSQAENFTAEQGHHDARTSPQRELSSEEKKSTVWNLNSISDKISNGLRLKNNPIKKEGDFYRNYRIISDFRRLRNSVTINEAYEAYENLKRGYYAKIYNETEAEYCRAMGIPKEEQ